MISHHARPSMKYYIILLLTLLLSQISKSQNCLVKDNNLKGEYIGECRNGKAHGKGTAKGIDTYTGEFVDGYPEGEGIYTWKNGDHYDGSWKKGYFQGKGTLTKKAENSNDSLIVLSGYWEHVKYIGKRAKPYETTILSNNISNVSVKSQPETDHCSILIIVKNMTGGGSSLSTPHLSNPKLVDIQVTQGRFLQRINDEPLSGELNKYILRDVTFPFSATLSFETSNPGNPIATSERVVIDLFESKNWYITISIDN